MTMFSWIRRRATYANVAMTLALVFAMTGGAYAAKKYLITSTKQISPSVLKSLQGKAGPVGAQGPVGAAGAQGPAGKDGANGKDGVNGKDGSAGANGKSVKVVNESPSNCTEGGFTYEVEGSGKQNEVCDGAKGAIHPGETLPSEATETGSWSYGESEALANNVTSSLPTPVNVTASFPIPLAKSIVHGAHLIDEHGKEMIINESTFALEGVSQTACKGTAEAPTAEPGNFCMYVTKMTGVAETYGGSGATVASALIQSPGATTTAGPPYNGSGSTGTTGAHLPVSVFPGASEGWGTWAVTAP
jgi:hypothetical protein